MDYQGWGDRPMNETAISIGLAIVLIMSVCFLVETVTSHGFREALVQLLAFAFCAAAGIAFVLFLAQVIQTLLFGG